MLNVINSAIQAVDRDRGRIHLRIHRAPVKCEAAFACRGNGPGIAVGIRGQYAICWGRTTPAALMDTDSDSGADSE